MAFVKNEVHTVYAVYAELWYVRYEIRAEGETWAMPLKAQKTSWNPDRPPE